MNSPEAVRRRLLKYVIPVLILSILFNVPKFMEATIEMVPESTSTQPPETTPITFVTTESMSSEAEAGAFSVDGQVCLLASPIPMKFIHRQGFSILSFS